MGGFSDAPPLFAPIISFTGRTNSRVLETGVASSARGMSGAFFVPVHFIVETAFGKLGSQSPVPKLPRDVWLTLGSSVFVFSLGRPLEHVILGT